MVSESSCRLLPGLWTAFVDAFVDFCASGVVPPATEKSKGNGAAKPPPSRLPATERLVAIGDVHGDLDKVRAALRLAGLINDQDRWIGGRTTLVQVGDILDRGDDELEILHLFERLKAEAARAGGAVHVLNGNHETISVEGRFRYATAGAYRRFDKWAEWDKNGRRLKRICQGTTPGADVMAKFPARIPEKVRTRLTALHPGGPVSSRFFARNPTVLVVGSTVFVHGGLHPHHVDYGLDKINKETSDWIQGKSGLAAPSFLQSSKAVVWARDYSHGTPDCKLLQETLDKIPGAKRMVVGHTIQHPMGVNGACDNKVFRVDVGMSQGCGGAKPQVLDIRNDREMWVLSEDEKPVLVHVEPERQKGSVISDDVRIP